MNKILAIVIGVAVLFILAGAGFYAWQTQQANASAEDAMLASIVVEMNELETKTKDMVDNAKRKTEEVGVLAERVNKAGSERLSNSINAAYNATSVATSVAIPANSRAREAVSLAKKAQSLSASDRTKAVESARNAKLIANEVRGRFEEYDEQMRIADASMYEVQAWLGLPTRVPTPLPTAELPIGGGGPGTSVRPGTTPAPSTAAQPAPTVPNPVATAPSSPGDKVPLATDGNKVPVPAKDGCMGC